MGQGSNFSNSLRTKGGGGNFITQEDIKNNDSMAKTILSEMVTEGAKFSREKIIFVVKLENGRKIFLETDALEHIIQKHFTQFSETFNLKDESELSTLLNETISKGKLIESYEHISNGQIGYRNVYYYKGKYSVVFANATNGYIITAFPAKIKGDK